MGKELIAVVAGLLYISVLVGAKFKYGKPHRLCELPILLYHPN